MREIIELIYSSLAYFFDFDSTYKTKTQKLLSAFIGLIIFFLCICALILGIIAMNK